MVLRRISAFFDALIAAITGVPLERYLEDKREQMMSKEGLEPEFSNLINIGKDGRIEIDHHLNPGERVEHHPQNRNPYIQDKYDQLNIEVSGLDRGIREEEERLQRLRDEERIAANQVEPTGPLRRDKLLALLCFVILSIGEIGALAFFLADWFGVDPSRFVTEVGRNPLGVALLIPVATGLFGFLVTTAGKVVENWEKQKPSMSALYLGILLLTGISLGIMRSLQATGGELNWGVILVCVLLTSGVPVVAAKAELWWRESTLRLDQAQAPLVNLQKEIRECLVNLRELHRLRQNADRRRETLSTNLQGTEQRKIDNRAMDHNKNMAALRRIAACLTIYKQAYLWHKTRRLKKEAGK